MTNIADVNSWEEIKKRLRKRYLELIDSDFAYPEGKREDMMVKLASKLGKNRQQLTKIIAVI